MIALLYMRFDRSQIESQTSESRHVIEQRIHVDSMLITNREIVACYNVWMYTYLVLLTSGEVH